MQKTTYEEYEKECRKIKERNKLLLNDFANWLVEKSLAKGAINRNLSNIDFYINAFLLHKKATEAGDGHTDVGLFLGFWFIKKAMWSCKSAIKSPRVLYGHYG